MTYWMCEFCGHCLNDSKPPHECTYCGQKCTFHDVTCYRVECGGERNVDPLLTSDVGSRFSSSASQRHDAT